MDNEIIIRTENLYKRFGSNTVLKNVNIEIKKNEIHAIVGENGAGKSTLIKIISGEYTASEGKVILKDKDITSLDAKDIQNEGLSVIAQHLNVIPSMTVADNILSADLPTKAGFLTLKKGHERALENLRVVSEHLELSQKVEDLSVAECQLVAIARSLITQPDILILDEPTARLGMEESEQLFKMIGRLKENGVTIIYISHRLEEIYNLCERVSIFRDGELVITEDLGILSEAEMISHMIGRSLDEFKRHSRASAGDVVLDVKDLSYSDRVKGVSFDVKKGEVVGLVGSVGAGKTEIIEMLFGAVKADSGTISMRGKPIHEGKKTAPYVAVRNDIASIAEDRQIFGLVLDYTIKENLSLVDLDKVCDKGIIRSKGELSESQSLMDKLSVRPNDVNFMAGSLSGGNMQKVCIGKWMFRDYDVYLMDEVTAGVDVGARAEIYEMMNGIVKNDASILLATSDIVEALGVCDRLIIMHRGNIVKHMTIEEATKESVLYYMMGGRDK